MQPSLNSCRLQNYSLQNPAINYGLDEKGLGISYVQVLSEPGLHGVQCRSRWHSELVTLVAAWPWSAVGPAPLEDHGPLAHWLCNPRQ